MDAVTLTYYGLVCGLLSLASPRLTRGGLRFAVGVVVGLVAAGVLPALRHAAGL